MPVKNKLVAISAVTGSRVAASVSVMIWLPRLPPYRSAGRFANESSGSPDHLNSWELARLLCRLGFKQSKGGPDARQEKLHRWAGSSPGGRRRGLRGPHVRPPSWHDARRGARDDRTHR